MNRTAFLIVLASCVIAGCGKRPATEGSRDKPAEIISETAFGALVAKPFLQRSANSSQRFQRVLSEQTGVRFVNRVDPDHVMNRLYHSGFVCGGLAIGDVDGDTRPDLYLVSAAGLNKLYRNLGDFRFDDVSARAGVSGGETWGAGAAMVDIDNDGDLDIYVCNYDSPNLLYVNRGDGTFDESAKSWGLDIVDACLMPAFRDYDRDGDLDLYLLTNRYYQAGGRPRNPPWEFDKNGQPYVRDEYKKYYMLKEIAPGRFNIDDYGRPDRFFRNNGDGTFSDFTSQAGISGVGYGLSATWWDYDSDGWPDLYVCNDFNDPDRLYRNNADGTFTDVLVDSVSHTSWFSMGSDAGDINNDGLFDFLCVDMSATTHFKQKTTMGVMNAEKLAEVAGPPPQFMRNTVFLNTGTGRFMEVAYLAGIADSDWSWAAKLADLDDDGWLDVFVSNGMVRNFNDSDVPFELSMLIGRTRWDLYQHLPKRPEQNLAFRNLGNLQFEDVSSGWGLDHVGMSYGTALSDLDTDGDLDLVVMNVDEPISIYRNDSTDGHRITIRLRGTSSNRFGLGAVARLETPAGVQVRQMSPFTGFLSSNEPIIHFGLGEHRVIDRLTIQWPSGKRQVFERLAADRAYTIEEADEPDTPTKEPQPATMFVQSDALSELRHREQPYDDFSRQPLLPNKLSQLGPGMAWGDVDQDGDEDLYVGGAAGSPGLLAINEGGRFQTRQLPAFANDAACEDMGALFLDVDADNDEDLYVVSGGYEFEPADERLRDRLYLNDGQGKFQPASGSLPDVRDSGSVVAAADFDRDGDLDLFVGGRMVPGSYPLPASSRLLRNDQGRFTDVTNQLAEQLSQSGLVTGAIWSDANSDGWCDLLVTHEWGPVKVFMNEQGRLTDRTQQAGIQSRTGWWNGIVGRDLDGDCDIDYVISNCGLNTKYHASLKKPAVLYYGDFENRGRMRLVEAEFEGDKLFPIRGKSCSTNAMPFLGKQFQTYHQFALAELHDLYTDQCLNEAHRFEVTTLRSAVLINDGQGRFEFRSLPRIAQASPGFGVALTEVNGDGRADLFIVQNFFQPQPETGQMDGGLSQLLLGNGDGTFTPVSPQRSGLIVPGDATSLAVIDLNGDSWPDFSIGVNDRAVMSFLNRGEETARPITVKLQGSRGNPHAIGARLTLSMTSGKTQTAELHAGYGYLSQSPAVLTFGQPSGQVLDAIEVIWPSGQTTRTPCSADKTQYHIQMETRTSD